MNLKCLIAWSFCGALYASTATAEYTYMGHCTNDASVSAEDIIAACTGFISRALQESWQMEDIPAAMVYTAGAYDRLGKDEKAEAELKIVITRYPHYIYGWVSLGELLEKVKGPGMLLATMDLMVRSVPNDPWVLNEACWIRATKAEQLDTAIADCNAALQLKPGNAQFLDSRSFAYFRAGYFAQAIADANSALATDPKKVSSLYVRGLAKLKSGDAAGGNADVAAANAIDAKIDDTYAGYGVTR